MFTLFFKFYFCFKAMRVWEMIWLRLMAYSFLFLFPYLSVVSGKDSDFLERPRKEKDGSVSLVSEEGGEVRGGDGSEDEEEQRCLWGGRSHRSKLNGKVDLRIFFLSLASFFCTSI